MGVFIMRIVKTCKNCNNEFNPYRTTDKYCSAKCRLEDRSRYLKAIRQHPKMKTCQFCNNEYQPYNSLSKFCSYGCMINFKKSQRTWNWNEEQTLKRTGKNNPAYKNGERSNGKFYSRVGIRLFNKNAKEIKQSMIEDMGYIYCEYCNTSNTPKWEAHHIIFRSEKPKHKNLHDKVNILIACIKCHNELHKHKGLRNKIVEVRKLNLIFGNNVLFKPS